MLASLTTSCYDQATTKKRSCNEDSPDAATGRQAKPQSASSQKAVSGWRNPSPAARFRRTAADTATVSPRELGRTFGALGGVLSPSRRLAHTNAITRTKNKEQLAEEWHELLRSLDPTHPEYAPVPLAQELDPYTLAYTSLLIKEAAAGAFPQQVAHGASLRPTSAREAKRQTAGNTNDVSAFIKLLDQLLDGAITRIRDASETKPSGKGKYAFETMHPDERVDVLRRVYNHGASPVNPTLSSEVQRRLHDHLRLGKKWLHLYGDQGSRPAYKNAGCQVDLTSAILDRALQDASRRSASQLEHVVTQTRQQERATADGRQRDAVTEALTTAKREHEAAVLLQQQMHEDAMEALRSELTASMQAALERQREEHEQALQELRAQHAADLAKRLAAQQAQQQAAGEQHAGALEAALAAQKEEHRLAMAEALRSRDLQHATELQSQQGQHQQELRTALEELQAKHDAAVSALRTESEAVLAEARNTQHELQSPSQADDQRSETASTVEEVLLRLVSQQQLAACLGRVCSANAALSQAMTDSSMGHLVCNSTAAANAQRWPELAAQLSQWAAACGVTADQSLPPHTPRHSAESPAAPMADMAAEASACQLAAGSAGQAAACIEQLQPPSGCGAGSQAGEVRDRDPEEGSVADPASEPAEAQEKQQESTAQGEPIADHTHEPACPAEDGSQRVTAEELQTVASATQELLAQCAHMLHARCGECNARQLTRGGDDVDGSTGPTDVGLLQPLWTLLKHAGTELGSDVTGYVATRLDHALQQLLSTHIDTLPAAAHPEQQDSATPDACALPEATGFATTETTTPPERTDDPTAEAATQPCQSGVVAPAISNPTPTTQPLHSCSGTATQGQAPSTGLEPLAAAAQRLLQLLATLDSVLRLTDQLLSEQQAPPPWLRPDILSEPGAALATQLSRQLSMRTGTVLPEDSDPAAGAAQPRSQSAAGHVQDASLVSTTAAAALAASEPQGCAVQDATNPSLDSAPLGSCTPQASADLTGEGVSGQARSILAGFARQLQDVRAAVQHFISQAAAGSCSAGASPAVGLPEQLCVLKGVHVLSMAVRQSELWLRQLHAAQTGGVHVGSAADLQLPEALLEYEQALAEAALLARESGPTSTGGLVMSIWLLPPVAQASGLLLGAVTQSWGQAACDTWATIQEAAARDLEHNQQLTQAQTELLLGHLAHLQEQMQQLAAAQPVATEDTTASAECDLLRTLVESLQAQVETKAAAYATLAAELQSQASTHASAVASLEVTLAAARWRPVTCEASTQLDVPVVDVESCPRIRRWFTRQNSGPQARPTQEPDRGPAREAGGSAVVTDHQRVVPKRKHTQHAVTATADSHAQASSGTAATIGTG